MSLLGQLKLALITEDQLSDRMQLPNWKSLSSLCIVFFQDMNLLISHFQKIHTGHRRPTARQKATSQLDILVFSLYDVLSGYEFSDFSLGSNRTHTGHRRPTAQQRTTSQSDMFAFSKKSFLVCLQLFSSLSHSQIDIK